MIFLVLILKRVMLNGVHCGTTLCSARACCERSTLCVAVKRGPDGTRTDQKLASGDSRLPPRVASAGRGRRSARTITAPARSACFPDRREQGCLLQGLFKKRD